MNNSLSVIGKASAKVMGAACLAAGAMAFSAVLASGAAVYAVGQGFKKGSEKFRDVIREEIAAAKAAEAKADAADMADAVDAVNTIDTVEVVAESDAAEEVKEVM